MDTHMDTPTATMETPLAAHHRASGAKMDEFAGCILPDTFSDFSAEYRAGKESVAVFDTNWHAIFRLTGRDRVRYLHAITSNNVKDLGEGYGLLALLLNPQGRILAELEVYALKESLLVLSHGSVRERTAATLKKYILGSQVTLEDLTGTLGTLAVEGPHAASVIAEATGLALGGFSELATQEVEIAGVASHLVRRSHFGGLGAQIIAPQEHLDLLWSTLLGNAHAQHGLPAGMRALNALRLESGVPWFPMDFNDGMIPHEAVLENTHISFSKGCYTGQEIVERVRSRGHVNRKRVSLKFSASSPPEPGAKLQAGGADVGVVTSSAFSPATDTAIGMGYLRRERNATGSIVEVEGGTAEVIAVSTTAPSA
jgi:folate-binding protein YgfZ